jgi:hypothetical protein
VADIARALLANEGFALYPPVSVEESGDEVHVREGPSREPPFDLLWFDVEPGEALESEQVREDGSGDRAVVAEAGPPLAVLEPSG